MPIRCLLRYLHVFIWHGRVGSGLVDVGDVQYESSRYVPFLAKHLTALFMTPLPQLAEHCEEKNIDRALLW